MSHTLEGMLRYAIMCAMFDDKRNVVLCPDPREARRARALLRTYQLPDSLRRLITIKTALSKSSVMNTAHANDPLRKNAAIKD